MPVKSRSSVYTYSHLEEDEIRLLRLFPGDWTSELKGSLEIYRLAVDEQVVAAQHFSIHRNGRDVYLAPAYEALSYLWGDSHAVTSIQITEDNRPYYLSIKPNLSDALQTFRAELHSGESKLFWIDAVCINQDETEEEKDEKSAQIRKMADIYGQAINVRVWLGMQSLDSDTAFTFISRFLKLDDIDGLARHPASNVEWAAFRRLMQRPWFKRRWVVQEIAFARHATVHCGRSMVEWKVFANAVSLFSLKHADLKDLFQSSETFHNNPDYLGEIDALGAKTLVEMVNILFRRTESGEVIEHLLSLEALMSILTAFDASIPHDTVYAILWLSHDAKPGSTRFSTAQHRDAFYFPPSPLYERPNPIDSIKEISILGENIPQSQSPTEDIKPHPSAQSHVQRSSLRSSGSQHLTGPPSTNLQVPAQQVISPFGKARTNSTATINRRKAENDPQTGDAKPPIEIIPDYKKSIFDLSKDFLEFVIDRSRSLDILCLPWVPTPKGRLEPEMPSWLPNVSGRPFGVRKLTTTDSRQFTTTDEVFSRNAADPLVGTPGLGARKYNACGRTRAYRRKTGHPTSPANYIHGRRLLTYGFVLDVIEIVDDVAIDGVIPGSWPEVAGWVNRSEPPPESFWRTLVADRGSDGPNPAPSYFELACVWAFGKPDQNANLNTGDLLKNVYGKCNSIAAAFLRRVQTVVWNRRLFVTKELPSHDAEEASSDLLGLGPRDARVGDLICILYGCSVPVVLRKKLQRNTSRRGRNLPKKPTLSDPPSSLYTLRRGTTISELAAEKEKVVTPATSPPQSPPQIHVATMASTGPGGSGTNRAEGSSSSTSTRPALNLRPFEDEYVLVGECYVHGMMDGDGFRRLIETKNEEQEFWLI